MKLPRTVIIHPSPALRRGNIAFTHGLLAQIPDDEHIEVVIRPLKISKTLAQLHTLFGLWFKWIAREVPLYNSDPEAVSINQIHRDMKQRFLARIFAENPSGYIQEMWTEKLAMLGEGILSSDPDIARVALANMKRHERKLSLSWASAEQMREYMDAVYWYWQDQGYAPPVPEKFYKIYEAEMRR